MRYIVWLFVPYHFLDQIMLYRTNIQNNSVTLFSMLPKLYS